MHFAATLATFGTTLLGKACSAKDGSGLEDGMQWLIGVINEKAGHSAEPRNHSRPLIELGRREIELCPSNPG